MTARARDLIAGSIERSNQFGANIEVDQFGYFDKGLSYTCYTLTLTGSDLPADLSRQTLIARLIGGHENLVPDCKTQELLRRECQTLQSLEGADLSISIPRYLDEIRGHDGELWGMLETFLTGIPLEMSGLAKPAESIGTAAAIIHAAPLRGFDHLQQWKQRRDHAEHWMGQIDWEIGEQFPVANQARDWIQSHLPDDRVPCRLLHGDLLPQNLKVGDVTDPDDISVIDWGNAKIGDPAYDFAIVSRANRKFAGQGSGLSRALDAYQEAGGASIAINNIRVYELLLLIGWLDQTAQEYAKGNRHGESPETRTERIAAFLRRMESQG